MRSLLCAATVLFFALTALGQDSLNVTAVSRFQLWDGAGDMAVAGSYAYIATGVFGLQVIDVSNPGDPRNVAELSLPGQPSELVVSGDFAYTIRLDSLYVVDISNPLAPTERGRLRLPYVPGWGLAVLGDLVVFACGYPHRLIIVDVSDHSAPELRGELETPNFWGGVVIRDSLVFYGGHRSGLHVVDIHDPWAPAEIGFISDLGGVFDVVLEGNYAYVSAWEPGSLRVIDISNPAALAQVAQVDFQSWPGDLELNQSRLYVCQDDTLRIMDIADPLQPVTLGVFSHACHCGMSASVVGETAYLGMACNELVIVDVSQPATPVELGRYDQSPANCVWGVSVYGNYLCLPYCTNRSGCGGLLVMDASNPTRLRPAAAVPGDAAFATVVRDHYAYVCQAYIDRQLDDPGEIVTYDLTDPTSPQTLGSAPAVDVPIQIALSDRYAYVTYPIAYLTVIDEQDPAHPVTVGSHYLPHFGVDLAVADSMLLVASLSGLRVYRTAEPETLVEIGCTLTEKALESVAVRDHYAYVSAWDDTFFVVDLAAPSAPMVVASCAAPGAWDLLVEGHRAYLACDSAGLHILDIADPTNPHEIGYHDTPSHAFGVAIRDSLIFVADYDNIGVYRYTSTGVADPRAVASLPHGVSLSAFPNPFNSSAVIRFELPSAGEVKMTVYDINGREVAELVHRAMPAGKHNVRFDGSSLSSGLYFVSLRTAQQSMTRKLVLLK